METNAPDPGKFGCSALKSSSKSTWLADSRKIPLQKCVVYQYISISIIIPDSNVPFHVTRVQQLQVSIIKNLAASQALMRYEISS